MNCNHPVTMELIIQALRYWVTEYHIDGFRFDLATVFNRDSNGNYLEKTPLLEFISRDPVLAQVILIAEPWDATDLYLLGKFAPLEKRWSEWNDKYKQNVRKFIKGTPGQKNLFASAVTGSCEIFPNSPYSSINYVVSHDGFSLADLVSFNEKNNVANGENNKDGYNHNDSWNCGHEGETQNKRILKLRQRQMRNFLALMLSQGIPMFFMGDEYGHTKNGNNNPWSQDNEMNWFLWNKLEENKNFYNFFKFLIHFRKKHSLLQMENRYTEKEFQWHGTKPEQPNWEKDNKLIAFTLHFPNGEPGLYAAFNSSFLYHNLVIPSPGEGKKWRWVVNTKNSSPSDFFEEINVITLIENTYRMAPYSSILLQTF